MGLDAILKVLIVLAVIGFPFFFRTRKTIGGTPMLLFHDHLVCN